ncbi:MAG: sigma-70 family RNA polymerase sigma factor [Firmicutes bacterium]|nr:sigma-70 family RNA polymerase sigma factor [Candidatus Fermentithermobacillaceae bacterium]
MEEIDGDTLRRCLQGDEEAARKLFRTYHRYVYSLCFGFAQSREEALDLCQESFVRVFRSLKDFDLSRPLKPWIRRVVINVCINYGRKKERCLETVSLQADCGGNQSPVPSISSSVAMTDLNPERHVELSETVEEVRKALRELSPEERLALVLRHQEGLDYAEIASVTGWPLGTVKTHLYRARQALRQKLVHLRGDLP